MSARVLFLSDPVEDVYDDGQIFPFVVGGQDDRVQSLDAHCNI